MKAEPNWYMHGADAIAHAREIGSGALQYYLLDGKPIPKAAAVRCPCGKSTVLVPVGGNGWQLEIHDDGTFSLSPSLLHSGTCTCHYFWKRGKHA